MAIAEQDPLDPGPTPSRIRTHHWQAVISLIGNIGLVVAAYPLLKERAAGGVWWWLFVFASGVVVTFATLVFLRISFRSGATTKYEVLLRSIDKSKRSTPVRTATTTAIDAVARRTHANRTMASVILTAALFLVLLTNLRSNHVPPQMLVILLIAAIVVLNASTLALDYRVSHGLFGTNEQEAREIVRFVLKNAADSDFSGGLGARELDLSAGTETALAAVWSGAPAYE